MSEALPHIFSGTMGALEGLIGFPACDKACGICLLAHPHPLHGGSMSSSVLSVMASAFEEFGFITVKHNSAGTGHSEGHFDNGVAETKDFLAVREQVLALDAVASKLAPTPSIIYAGFSFGAAVALGAHAQKPADFCALLGTPAGLWDLPQPEGNLCLIHGANDEVIPLSDVLSWAQPCKLSVEVVAGADHFFNRKLYVMKKALSRQIGAFLFFNRITTYS